MINRITEWQFLKKVRGLEEGDYIRIHLKSHLEENDIGYCDMIIREQYPEEIKDFSGYYKFSFTIRKDLDWIVKCSLYMLPDRSKKTKVEINLAYPIETDIISPKGVKFKGKKHNRLMMYGKIKRS